MNSFRRFLVHSVLALSTVLAGVGVSSVASAAKCSVSCALGSCSTSALFKKVYCYCDAAGHAVCGNKAPGFRSDPVDVASFAARAPEVEDDSRQMLQFDEIASRAYDVQLFDLGDLAARAGDALASGDPREFAEAFLKYEEAMSNLSDKEWELLEAGEWSAAGQAR